jgi:hypothetical protein
MVSKKIKRTEQHNPLSPPRKERKGKGKKKKRKVKLGSSFQSPAKSMAYCIHIKKWDFISHAIYISFFLATKHNQKPK